MKPFTKLVGAAVFALILIPVAAQAGGNLHGRVVSSSGFDFSIGIAVQAGQFQLEEVQPTDDELLIKKKKKKKRPQFETRFFAE